MVKRRFLLGLLLVTVCGCSALRLPGSGGYEELNAPQVPVVFSIEDEDGTATVVAIDHTAPAVEFLQRSNTMRNHAEKHVREYGARLAKNHERVVLLWYHGPEAPNSTLDGRRIDAVKYELTKGGLPEDQIVVKHAQTGTLPGSCSQPSICVDFFLVEKVHERLIVSIEVMK